MSGTSFTYIPKVGVTSDSFQVQVSDGHGGVSTATVNLSGLTTPSPTTNVDATSTPNVVTGKLNIPAGDTGSGWTYSKGSNGAAGTVVVNSDGSFTYTRTASGHSVSATDTFTINVTDSTGKTVTVASVTVAPQNLLNGGPTASLTTAPGIGNLNTSTWTQTTTGTVTASDPDGDTLTYTASNTNGATVTFDASGNFTYTMVKNKAYYHAAAKVYTAAEIANGTAAAATTAKFTVTVTDGFGGSTSFDVVVPISVYNSTPKQPKSGVQWKAGIDDWTSINADADADGDSYNYVVTKPPQHGSATYSTATGGTLNGSSLSNGDTIVLTVYDGYYLTDTTGHFVLDGSGNKQLASNARTYTY
ncbi:hypothetical protein B1R94_16010 [Mycolicibacterium litorale]|nr:hypothetical protein B1R94_16010 [Mycolicibacterium litorale]